MFDMFGNKENEDCPNDNRGGDGGEENSQRVFSAALSNLLLPGVNGETSITLFICVYFQR